MGNTLRYEGFRNVLLSQMRKRLSGKLGIKQISRRETVKNNDTVMEMLLVELEDGRAAPTLYLEDLYKAYREGATLDEILQGLCEMFTKYSAVKMPLENKLNALIDDLAEWENFCWLIRSSWEMVMAGSMRHRSLIRCCGNGG